MPQIIPLYTVLWAHSSLQNQCLLSPMWEFFTYKLLSSWRLRINIPCCKLLKHAVCANSVCKTYLWVRLLEKSLKGFCLRKNSVLWQSRNVPLNVPLDAFFNYSWVLNSVTLTFVSDTHILLNVLVFFSFYTSAASSVETEHNGHMSV